MTNSRVRWWTVNKEDLLDVFLGEIDTIGMKTRHFPEYEVRDGKLALGFRDDKDSYGGEIPTLLVIEDKFLSETISWLRVYAGEASPLSQFVRVVLRSDFQKFELNADDHWGKEYHPSRWACVAVGETLAQADGETDLQNMALSRLSSSFTLPLGRTSLNFGQGDSTKICVDRLRTIGSDRRFGKRAVSVEQLLPIWAIAGSEVATGMSAEDAAYLVLGASEKHFSTLTSDHSSINARQLKAYSGLASDSVEERVMAFHRLLAEFTGQQSAANADAYAPALAAAALLVGRSTSHVFLLKRLGKIAPVAFAWFGVMAALAGPRSWDAAWLRAVKGAERLLRPVFNWSDVSAADISWPEFAWFVGTFEGVEHLSSLPKMLPRTLAVEVVPGASLHVRLGGGMPEQESRPSNEPTVSERALQDALAQFIHLAQRYKGLIEPHQAPQNIQQSLDLGQERKPVGKSVRQRRTKKDTDPS